MKKFKNITIAVAAVATAVAVSAFAGCGGGNENNDASKDIVVGGNVTGDVAAEEISITGYDDIYLKTTDGAEALADYAANVKATDGKMQYDVEYDASNVTFGTKGEYQLTYSYEDKTVTVSVFVMTAPSISDERAGETFFFDYAEVNDGIFDGLSAEDCFGNALDVQLLDDDGLNNEDGTLNTGEFTLKFVVTDMAGNIVTTERTVTVTMNDRPDIPQSFDYDVFDDEFELFLDEDLYRNFVSLAIEGTVVPNSAMKKESGKISVSGDYVCSVKGEYDDQLSIRLVTRNGYADGTLNVKDEKQVPIDSSALQAFAKRYLPCFRQLDVPAVTLVNHRQKETPVYKIQHETDENATEISNGVCVFEKEGKYTLTVTVRGEVYSFEVSTYYDLGLSDEFSADENFSIQLPDGFTLKNVKVNKLGDEETLLAYYSPAEDEYDDMAAFGATLAGLNKKYRYVMTATALRGNQEYVQKVNFGVAPDKDNGVTIASGIAGLDNILVTDPSNVDLSVVDRLVGGRRNVYCLTTENSTTTWSNVIRIESTEISLLLGEGLLKAGTYLTFDVYLEEAATLIMASGNGDIAYLYNNAKFSADGLFTDGKATAKIYREDGSQITNGLDKNSFWNPAHSELIGRWVTVEVKLGSDFIPGNVYSGIGVYNNLLNKNVYISDIRASKMPLMEDDTVNGGLEHDVSDVDTSNENTVPDVDTSNENTVPDVWGGTGK